MGTFRTFLLLRLFMLNSLSATLLLKKKSSSTNNGNNLLIGVIFICITDQLGDKGSESVHFSSLYVTDDARHEHSVVNVCVSAWVTVLNWVYYWQLSPSPWADEAACCVGRGYTCSVLVRPQYRYTSHLRPVPSCRSASPPLGSGTEPAET